MRKDRVMRKPLILTSPIDLRPRKGDDRGHSTNVDTYQGKSPEYKPEPHCPEQGREDFVY